MIVDRPPVLWRLAWPLRWYVTHTPIWRGRTFLAYRVLQRLTPDGGSCFTVTLPGGGQAQLRYREVVGFETLLTGSFELAEINAVRGHARPGTVAIDVGANAGLFTVALASAAGSVWAVEPLTDNVTRILENVTLNGLTNVEVVAAAAHESEGSVTFNVAADPAFGSTEPVGFGLDTGRAITVPAVRLDSEWERRAMPTVSVMKVDVEGGELAVLRGAEKLLAACQPVLLVESSQPESIERHLAGLGYVRSTPAGFSSGNHLFLRQTEAS